MYHVSRSPSLVSVRVSRLRPTQLSVGYAECELKAEQWARLGRKRRKAELGQHVFPAILGPGDAYYIVDHHHLGIALINEGIE